MIYLRLFWEFLYIGLFAIGGGMATIPFLQRLSETTGWYDQNLISNMIAISQSTPGPIGINMATYVGYHVASLPGGIIATIGEILPSIVIVVLVSKVLERFRHSSLVDNAFYGLRPAVTGLIAAAAFDIMKIALLHIEEFISTTNPAVLADWGKLAFFAVMFILIRITKKHPVVYIAASAVVGILLKFT